MSVHIGAKAGQIAETILLPGDPMRAKFFADNLLEDAVCFNQVRGMLGYTGTYQGKRVSVMGSGMGIPSISIFFLIASSSIESDLAGPPANMSAAVTIPATKIPLSKEILNAMKHLSKSYVVLE